MNSNPYIRSISEEEIKELVNAIPDPEIPVLTISDLGILRSIDINEESVTITITPTYTGCPAMDMIAAQIRMALLAEGIESVQIRQTLSPAWTTDWISEEGRQKLEAYGIAPPSTSGVVLCPNCGSSDTRIVSEFGSTACKSLRQCNHCLEPFDYFKCH